MTLFLFYKKNGVKYRACHYKYGEAPETETKKRKTPEERFEERLTFAKVLAKVIMNKYPLIYGDEAAAHVWLRDKKTWRTAKDQVSFTLNPSRGKSITMFGAIGNCVRPYFYLGSKTSQDQFKYFLTELRKRISREGKVNDNEPVYILLDNAAAHKTFLTLEFVKSCHFEPLFIPAQTPEFNCIVRYPVSLI